MEVDLEIFNILSLRSLSVHCVRNVWRTGAMRIGEDCNFEVTTCAQMLYLRLYCIWLEIQPVEGSSLSYDSESVPIWEQRKSSRGAAS